VSIARRPGGSVFVHPAQKAKSGPAIAWPLVMSG
jgi:hypothetical protein